MKLALIISTVIHFLFFLALITTSERDSAQLDRNAKGTDSASKLNSKQEEEEKGKRIVSITLIAPQNSILKNCKNFYGGIGVNMQVFTQDKISEVHEGYPAFNAGLQVGDRVTPVDDIDITGPVGSFVMLKIERGFRVFTLKLKRAKICVE